jgi:hypothetical protein
MVTVSLELSGPDASLLDAEHRMDSLFGVVNIPNVVWIDEDGVIVRPAEPGWPEARQAMPLATNMRESMPRMSRAKTAPPPPENRANQSEVLTSGQDRDAYPNAIRDWVAKGADSEYALSPREVIAGSQPRDPDRSRGAAHFELANHLWRAGARDAAIDHFNDCHQLQPDNWTYKRQAWSLVGNERVGGDFGRFIQGPLVGEEDDWPFASDFRSDTAQLGPGEYYPKTM